MCWKIVIDGDEAPISLQAPLVVHTTFVKCVVVSSREAIRLTYEKRSRKGVPAPPMITIPERALRLLAQQ